MNANIMHEIMLLVKYLIAQGHNPDAEGGNGIGTPFQEAVRMVEKPTTIDAKTGREVPLDLRSRAAAAGGVADFQLLAQLLHVVACREGPKPVSLFLTI